MLNEARRAVLTDIAYEIGGAGLAAFHKMLQALRDEQWATAASELRSSLLFTQVPRREQENMMILVLGTFPTGITCVTDLVKKHEGCSLTAQPDAKGKWALGYGHDVPPPGQPGHVASCTQQQAEDWITQNLILAEQRAKADIGPEYW